MKIIGDDRTLLTREEALAMLPEGEYIHAYMQGEGAILGADWERESLIESITYGRCELAGKLATSRGHGLLVNALQDNSIIDEVITITLFVETKREESK